MTEITQRNRYTLLLWLLVLPILRADAQNIAYFTDKLQRFWVFDAGQFYKLEHLPAKNIQLGGNFLIYEDQLNQLKEYRQANTKILDYMPVGQYFRARQYLMTGDTQGALRVYFDGKNEIITLTTNMPDYFDYALGDSIIALIDFDRYLKAFYKGKRQDISNQTIREYRVSDNSVCYLTEGETFHVFYDGTDQEIDTAFPNAYSVGNNGFVAYLNRFNELWVFEKGNNQQLTNVQPQNWAAGDNLLAWVNENGNFMCHYQGNTQELSPLAPRQYAIVDSLLSYTDERGFFNVFYRGKNYLVETYQPQKIQQAGGIVAYLDLDGRVKAFYEGEQVSVSPEIVDDFKLMGRAIVYTLNTYGTNSGDAQVYWNKEHYKQ